MRIDENGVQHPQAIDEVTSTTLAHIAECVECSREFPKVLAKSIQLGYNMSDEFVKSKTQDDSVEWYLRQLSETDKQISDLIHKRSSLRETIQARMGKLNEAIYSSDDWFNGDVRGNPVEDRCIEAPAETRSDYNQRRF